MRRMVPYAYGRNSPVRLTYIYRDVKRVKAHEVPKVVAIYAAGIYRPSAGRLGIGNWGTSASASAYLA